jgi:hypothetical protein
MDLKLLLAYLGPDTSINSKGTSFQNTKFIENITFGLSKDVTQMASGRTASQLLLQMAAEATDQNVKFTLLKIVLSNFMKRHKEKNQNFLSICKCIPNWLGPLQDGFNICDIVQPQTGSIKSKIL